MPLTQKQIDELNRAYARGATGQATKTNLGDNRNIELGKAAGWTPPTTPATPATPTVATDGLAGYDQRLKDQAAAMNNTGNNLMGAVGYRDPALVAEENRQAELARVASLETVDEADIQRKMTDRFQAEIDMTNRLYAEKAAEAKLAGTGRLGSSGAIQARRGLLGSDFGAAQTNIVEQANKKEQDMLDAEKALALNEIYATIKTNSVAEAAAKRKAVTEGSDAYIKHLGKASEQRVTDAKGIIKALLAKGQVLDDALAEDLATKLKMDKASFFQMYQEGKATFDSEAATAKTAAEKAALDMSISQADLISKQAAATEAQVGKDYEYVSTPAQRDALKKQGYTEKVVNGKTYMKAPELKVEKVTDGKNTYMVTTGKDGKIIRKELVGSSSTGGGSDTKEEAAFYSDVDKQLTLLQNGDRDWGESFAYLKAKYDAPAEVIDNLLNKKVWAEPGAYENREAIRKTTTKATNTRDLTQS